MNALDQAKQIYCAFIEGTVSAALPIVERLEKAHHIRLIENEDSSITLQQHDAPGLLSLPEHCIEAKGVAVDAVPRIWRTVLSGSHVKISLRSSRFVSQPLELPKQASDFLEGIVRSQLDRLTPWHPNDALFGWTCPVEDSTERLKLNVIATPRSSADHLAAFAQGLGAKKVTLSTLALDSRGNSQEVQLSKAGTEGPSQLRTYAPVFSKALLIAVSAAILLLLCSTVIGSFLQSQRDRITQEIQERRSHLSAAGDGSAQSVIVRRKMQTAASVIALEELSRILPDDTVASEIAIERGRLQISGSTRDANSLIGIIEKSPQFATANFFAPTTRSLNNSAQQFHIEMQMKPNIGVGQ